MCFGGSRIHRKLSIFVFENDFLNFVGFPIVKYSHFCRNFKLKSIFLEAEALPLAEANAEANVLAEPPLPPNIDETQFVMGIAAAVDSIGGSGSGSSGSGSGCSCKKKKRKNCSECSVQLR